ncbi:hypothetical protein FQN50_005576 [Emmonsiellopsis sp. PD_5]|nr:hypothetical protein FQN50_005576 [Emmonsiellopsis sp. PD_5]
MGSTSHLPEELALTLSRQWPCRELQIRQLAGLLSPALPSPPAIIVHGPQSSGKSGVLGALLAAYNAPAAADGLGNARQPTKRKRDVDAGRSDTNGLTQRDINKSLPYAIVKCAECITVRHLLGKIISRTITALSAYLPTAVNENDPRSWVEETLAKAKCEHISLLPGVLKEILDSVGCQKLILILDGVDGLREGGQMLLAALGRLGELVPSICVLFVMKTSPRPLLLQIPGVPHVNFPPYSRNDAISIVAASPPHDLPGVSSEIASRIYPPFLAAIYDSLIGPTASTIPVFRSACEKLWPRFISPITNNEKPPGLNTRAEWDFSRLLVRNRALFQHQGEAVLVHHIVPDDPPPTSAGAKTSSSITPATSNASSPFPSLPYLPTLILTSAFLAAHIPPRLDTIFFSKFSSSSLSARNKRAHHRRRLKVLSQAQAQEQDLDTPEATPKKPGKRVKSKHTKITKSTLSSALASSSGGPAAGAGFINPRPFPLERLLAIYRAIDPNPPPQTAGPLTKPFADTIYPELATLQRLRLLVPASSAAGADGSEKWCLNANVAVSSGSAGPSEWIAEMARGIGVEVGEYIAGGLD